jgi:hypothetical protein
MGTLDWQPYGMCGVQAQLVDGETVIVEGFQSGQRDGFVLVYRYGQHQFTTRADAYAAAELLNTVLFLGGAK